MNKKSTGVAVASMAALMGSMRPFVTKERKAKTGSTCDPDAKKKRRVQKESRRRNRR